MWLTLVVVSHPSRSRVACSSPGAHMYRCLHRPCSYLVLTHSSFPRHIAWSHPTAGFSWSHLASVFVTSLLSSASSATTILGTSVCGPILDDQPGSSTCRASGHVRDLRRPLPCDPSTCRASGTRPVCVIALAVQRSHVLRVLHLLSLSLASVCPAVIGNPTSGGWCSNTVDGCERCPSL